LLTNTHPYSHVYASRNFCDYKTTDYFRKNSEFWQPNSSKFRKTTKFGIFHLTQGHTHSFSCVCFTSCMHCLCQQTHITQRCYSGALNLDKGTPLSLLQAHFWVLSCFVTYLLKLRSVNIGHWNRLLHSIHHFIHHPLAINKQSHLKWMVWIKFQKKNSKYEHYFKTKCLICKIFCIFISRTSEKT